MLLLQFLNLVFARGRDFQVLQHQALFLAVELFELAVELFEFGFELGNTVLVLQIGLFSLHALDRRFWTPGPGVPLADGYPSAP